MAERGTSVDHSTVHRWALKVFPRLEQAFRRHKRPVGKSWRMDETYIRVKGEWKYLYRAVDKNGNAIDFLLRAHRDKTAAQRYSERSIKFPPRSLLRQTRFQTEWQRLAMHLLNVQRNLPERHRFGAGCFDGNGDQGIRQHPEPPPLCPVSKPHRPLSFHECAQLYSDLSLTSTSTAIS
jgi:hypothetical protein